MNYEYDEEMPYKKKSNRKSPTKANHKHDFQSCLFDFDGITLDKAHGFVPRPQIGAGTYCVICGKIGGISFKEPDSINEALPRFRVDNIWSQKFVCVNEEGANG